MTVLVEQIVVAGSRRPLDEDKIAQLTESILSVGLLHPILVVVRKAGDGAEHLQLVAGLHRLEAVRRLGLGTIRCTVLQCDGALRVELAEIDENIIRHNPSPAEHALLTQRRSEIIKELAAQRATLTQVGTPSKQALRRAGQRTGHDVDSVRDQAKRTGESKGKIQRSKNRSRVLGGVLKKLIGTSLDKGPELHAMTKLPEEERNELANRASSGEVVSARTVDRKPNPKPGRKSKPTREKALGELDEWDTKYHTLEELKGYEKHIGDLQVALMNPEDRPEGYVPLPLLQGEDLGDSNV